MSVVHLRGTVNQVLLFCTPCVNDVTKMSHYMLTLDVPRDVTVFLVTVVVYRVSQEECARLRENVP